MSQNVAVSSTGLIRAINNHSGQVYSADYVRRVELAAEQRIEQHSQRHWETTIIPFIEAANGLKTWLAIIDGYAAITSDPNARPAAKNALKGADDELAAAYLAYTRFSSIEGVPDGDLIALHVQTRIEAIQKFLKGADSGEALRAVVQNMGGTYQRSLQLLSIADLTSLPGTKAGLRNLKEPKRGKPRDGT